MVAALGVVLVGYAADSLSLQGRQDYQTVAWASVQKRLADVISDISLVELAAGDLIFSGTPAGVGQLQPGDRVHGAVAGVAAFDFEVGPARRQP